MLFRSRRAGKIWIQTHFNHPREITPETERACRNLVNAGMPVSNHAVLLKGVNDSVPVMRELMRGLLRIKVRPYYLFHCDPVVGAGHFRTSVWKGLEIIEGLRGHMSGLGVPTYVVDGLHGAGKIPLMPNYLVSAADNAVILRNYEGMLFRYAPEDRDGGGQTHYESLGVSSLLGGGLAKLMPEGNRRMARRAEHDAEVNGNGHHNGNGHANGNGKLHKNGHAKLNGDGHANGNGNGHANGRSLSLRDRAGVRAGGNGESLADLPIIDRLS